VDHAANGALADQILRQESFDLIVLDLNLPKLDGFEVLRRLRAHQSPSPVLILSARDQDQERVRGLDLGADDYLVKPFSINELLARVRALLRRSQHGPGLRELRHAALSFDGVSRTASVGDVPLDLSPREVSLLEALLTHFGHVISKERLLSQVYGYEGEVGLNTIEVYIHRLRKKLAGSGVVLRTAHGRGYLLDLERSDKPAVPSE
jgi:two-component system OmpR family response regulator